MGTLVPEPGRIKLPLVQAGQKGQLGRAGGMLQVPGALRGAKGLAAVVLAQEAMAGCQNFSRGFTDLHQIQQVRPATTASRRGWIDFSAGRASNLHYFLIL